MLKKKCKNQRLALIIAGTVWVSIVTACAVPKPAPNWTFWKDFSVMTKSAADHLAIATSYRQSAEDYKRIAQEHERMKAEYAEYPDDTAEFMQTHCNRLVKKYHSLAEDMEVMAKEHEKLAALAKR